MKKVKGVHLPNSTLLWRTLVTWDIRDTIFLCKNWKKEAAFIVDSNFISFFRAVVIFEVCTPKNKETYEVEGIENDSTKEPTSMQFKQISDLL